MMALFPQCTGPLFPTRVALRLPLFKLMMVALTASYVVQVANAVTAGCKCSTLGDGKCDDNSGVGAQNCDSAACDFDAGDCIAKYKDFHDRNDITCSCACPYSLLKKDLADGECYTYTFTSCDVTCPSGYGYGSGSGSWCPYGCDSSYAYNKRKVEVGCDYQACGYGAGVCSRYFSEPSEHLSMYSRYYSSQCFVYPSPPPPPKPPPSPPPPSPPPSPPPPSPPPPSPPKKKGDAAGIAVGVIFAVIVLCVAPCAWSYYRRKVAKDDRDDTVYDMVPVQVAKAQENCLPDFCLCGTSAPDNGGRKFYTMDYAVPPTTTCCRG